MKFSSYPHPMPEESSLSSAEFALGQQIIDLYNSHKKHIGKKATLKNRPECVVKIIEVTTSDYGIPRFYIEVVSINGRSVENASFIKSVVNRVIYPSSAFEGQLNMLAE